MTKRTTGAFLAALSAVTLSIAGCGGADAPVGADVSVLNRGLGPEPDAVSPHKAQTTQGQRIIRDLSEGLLGYTPDGRVVERAAASWDMSADGLTYTFRLRPEARWSNGDPVTADDFLFSFRRLVDPATASPYAEQLVAVVNARDIIDGKLPPEELGVEAVGPHELVIRLERATAHFPLLLTHTSTAPVHSGSIEEHGDRFARPGNLVSNGAYKLTDWTLGAVIEIERNEHYWNDDDTAIDVVRHHVTPQPMSELNRYRAGEIDITSNVPTQAFQMVREEHPDELRVSQVLNVYFYGFNLAHPDLANRDLREALSLAIDREEIAEDIVARGEKAAYSFVPPETSNYDPPQIAAARMSKEEREARARQLYADAGYSEDNPLVIELRYNTSDDHRRVALAVHNDWKRVLGFEAELVNEQFKVLVENVQAMQITQVFRLSWRGEYDDAHAFLSIMASGHPGNYYNYASKEYDELLKKAGEQTDLTARRLYFEEAEHVFLQDLPVIPLYFFVSKHLVRNTICGWEDNVLDYHYSQHLSFCR